MSQVSRPAQRTYANSRPDEEILGAASKAGAWGFDIWRASPPSVGTRKIPLPGMPLPPPGLVLATANHLPAGLLYRNLAFDMPRSKAIHLPSGDQAGYTSEAGSSVSRRWFGWPSSLT